jgi:mannose-1-phosphate guanylyltransferase
VNALLLAAGLGTRLRPLTESVPKCLAPIRGRPLLAYWLDLLVEAGAERLVVNLHHLAAQVEAFLDESPHRARVLAVREPTLLGTGGSILRHRPLLGPGPFMVVHADNLSRFDVRAFVARHRDRPRGCELTMMTFESQTPSSCGIVEVDAAGVVTSYQEKPARPRGRLANAAVYVMEDSVVERLRAGGATAPDLSTQVLPALVGRMVTFHNAVYHRDIGTPEALAQAQADDAYLA